MVNKKKGTPLLSGTDPSVLPPIKVLFRSFSCAVPRPGLTLGHSCDAGVCSFKKIEVAYQLEGHAVLFFNRARGLRL